MTPVSAAVVVVAVSYHGSRDLPGLVAGLRAGAGDWRLVVVDNADDVREGEALRTAVAGDDRVRVVDAGSNLGYLGGARRGLAEVDPASTRWLVVTNTDVRVAPDFVERLAALPDDAIVAPAVLSSVSGADQNPFLARRPSRATVLRWRAQFATVTGARLVVALGQLRSVLRRAGGSGIAPIGRPCRIYAPHGSCLVLPASFFARPGSLDHGAFLFGEEITIAERARSLGCPVLYEPALVVHHDEHRATGWWRSRQLLAWQRESVREIARLLDDSPRPGERSRCR